MRWGEHPALPTDILYLDYVKRRDKDRDMIAAKPFAKPVPKKDMKEGVLLACLRLACSILECAGVLNNFPFTNLFSRKYNTWAANYT